MSNRTNQEKARVIVEELAQRANHPEVRRLAQALLQAEASDAPDQTSEPGRRRRRRR